MTKQELITQLNEEFDTCEERLNHWKQTANQQMIGYFDGKIHQILLTLEALKNLNEETRKDFEEEKCKHIPKAYPMPIGVKCVKCGKNLFK